MPLHIQWVWTCPDAGLISHSCEQIESDNYIFKRHRIRTQPYNIRLSHSRLIHYMRHWMICQTHHKWVIPYLSPFNVFQPPLSCFALPFLSPSVDGYKEHLFVLSGKRQTIEFWKWHGTRHGSIGWLPPSVFLPLKASLADCPLFHDSISRGSKTVENPVHHVSSSAMSSLWPPPQFHWLTWIWKMNMGQLLRFRQVQQETGLSTMKWPLQREYGQIWIGWRHFHPWEISWPLFYV